MKLFLPFANNQKSGTLAVAMRKKRFEFFLRLANSIPRPITILDIGGAEKYWSQMEYTADDGVRIVLLNIKLVRSTTPRMYSVIGDAIGKLPFKDQEFDIVYSNSVIEHLQTHESQIQMAEEVRRVGRAYFIQTPNKYFPIEPHFHVPGFQFMPLRLRMYLLQHFELGFMPSKAKDPKEAERIAREIRLLSRKEFASLFPGATIYDERIAGLIKSFVAYGGWHDVKSRGTAH
jgi:hypothetical protein